MASVKQTIDELRLNIPYSDNLDILKKSISVSGKKIPNRLAIQPMEGCDGTADGNFSELTLRRYDRFAKSGAGLIWMEACAIVPEGRANPRQLQITECNVESYKRVVSRIRETAMKENGISPLIILQITHSGRYSKPNGTPEPLIAYNKPIFEKNSPIDSSRIVSDDYLKSLEEKYALAANLAEKAGFDGVDIKCCHGYLVNELMGAHLRPGLYGGSFENRTRLFYNAIKAAKAATKSNFIVTSRMNVYDGFPYPYGFGVSEESVDRPDLTEPKKVFSVLRDEFNTGIVDITIGNPYVNSHVNRPFNVGAYPSPENPLCGVERMFYCVGEMQKAYPDMCVVGSGFSYLGAEGAQIAAGAIEEGICTIAGFGRQSFAYPDFPKDILLNGRMSPEKCCIACSKCTELMRANTVSGCVIRDKETYMPYYKKFCSK